MDEIIQSKGTTSPVFTISTGNKKCDFRVDNGILQFRNFGGTWQAVGSGSGGGDLTNVVITSNTTATAGNRYLLDSTSNTVDLTLPLSPSVDDEVGYIDFKGTALTYDQTVLRNGETIQGEAENLTIDNTYAAADLVFTTAGWIMKSGVRGS